MTDRYINEIVRNLRKVADEGGPLSRRIKIGHIDLNDLTRRAAEMLAQESARAAAYSDAESALYARIGELEDEIAALRKR